jgi:hypothetical protein
MSYGPHDGIADIPNLPQVNRAATVDGSGWPESGGPFGSGCAWVSERLDAFFEHRLRPVKVRLLLVVGPPAGHRLDAKRPGDFSPGLSRVLTFGQFISGNRVP